MASGALELSIGNRARLACAFALVTIGRLSARSVVVLARHTHPGRGLAPLAKGDALTTAYAHAAFKAPRLGILNGLARPDGRVSVRVIVTALALTLASSERALSVTLEYPHAEVNSITCSACHDSPGSIPAGFGPHSSLNADDTEANNLCLSCHNDIEAPFVRTHSSLTTSGQYGGWSIECTTCHQPHDQPQAKTYGAASYAHSGVATAVGVSTIAQAGAGWAADEWVGWLVIGNVANPALVYRILSNTGDTLTLEGTVNQTVVTPGSTFAIVYGKLILSTVTTPNSGQKAVRFFGPEGTHSFADGDGALDGICEVCHTQTTHYRNDGSGSDQHHANVGVADGRRCVDCHSHQTGFAHGGGSGGGGGQSCGTATSCHGTLESHPAHVAGVQLSLDCSECHDTTSFPQFSDGQDKAGTHVCDSCHTADGVALAKSYWEHPGSSAGFPGSWAVVEGERVFCGSCHDSTPGNTKSDGSGSIAANVLGDDATYGFYVTGHGKQTGSYARMSWQDSTAAGNPAANLATCSSCHDLMTAHFGAAGKRLRQGFDNDQANTNCKQCHSWDGSEGVTASSPPHFYTTSAEYEGSAHKDQLCTDCHDVHGASGPYTGMTRAGDESLCYQCHTAGVVQNDAVSGPALATDIQQALTLPYKHDLHTAFTKAGKTYTLQCTTCHNAHVVTGKYWDASQGKSPVTRPWSNTSLWGASTGEKMSDYAGSGTYQVPNGDPFAGDVLPDYATFCTDCHDGTTVIYSPSLSRDLRAFEWSSDKHGGLAGQHSNTALLAPYEGAQLGRYVLSCTDCHEAHGSTNNYGMRTTVNDGTVTVTEYGLGNGGREWDSLCGQCHTSISDWHHWYYQNTSTACTDCHYGHSPPYRNCADCHSHPGMTPAPTFTPTPTSTATTPTPGVTPTSTATATPGG
jgi:predicted CXXCH cytochrome family protein